MISTCTILYDLEPSLNRNDMFTPKSPSNEMTSSLMGVVFPIGGRRHHFAMPASDKLLPSRYSSSIPVILYVNAVILALVPVNFQSQLKNRTGLGAMSFCGVQPWVNHLLIAKSSCHSLFGITSSVCTSTIKSKHFSTSYTSERWS